MVSAATLASGVIAGVSDVYTPVYIVTLPTKLDFTLDALSAMEGGHPLDVKTYLSGVESATKFVETPKTGDETSQVASQSYAVINFSDTPVVVGFNVKATVANSTALVAADAATLVPHDSTQTTKDIALGIISGLPTTTTSAPVALTDALYDSDPASKTTVYFDPTESTCEFAFALEKGKTQNTLPTDATSVAVFRFYGQFNDFSAIEWKANDIKVVGSYKLQGVGDATFSDITGTSKADMLADGSGAKAGQLLSTVGMAKYIKVTALDSYFTNSFTIKKGTATAALSNLVTAEFGLAAAQKTIAVNSVTLSVAGETWAETIARLNTGTTTVSSALSATVDAGSYVWTTDTAKTGGSLQFTGGAVGAAPFAANGTTPANNLALPAGTYVVTVEFKITDTASAISYKTATTTITVTT